MAVKCKILLLLLLSFSEVIAQLEVKNFYGLTGRKDVPMHVIAQDGTGFLWLGTADGLYRFDGREAEKILPDHTALSTPITALMVDKQQRVWVGTGNGKVYRLSGNRLDSLDLMSVPVTDRITAFYPSENGMFIGTYGNGLLLNKNDSVYVFNRRSGLSDDVVYTVTGNGDGTIWCGTDAGITAITFRGDSTPHFDVISSKDGLPDNIVRKIHARGERLTVAMQDSGVIYFDPAQRRFSRGSFFTSWTLGAVLDARTLDSTLYIVTEREGLLHIARGVFAVYSYEDLSVSRINSVFFDNAHQVWIASQKGLSRLSEKRLKFIGPQQGLADNKVLALTTDDNHVIWIGTTQGISKIMTDDKGRVVVDKIHDLEKYTISCAVKAPGGSIWFGTYGSGVIILNSNTGESRIINSESHGLPNDNISNVHFAKGGQVYISTLGGGLVKARIADGKSPEIIEVYNEARGLGSNYVYAAITDRQGKLYVATDGGGLEVLHGRRFINLTERYRLKSNNVFSLCVDTFNNVWAVSNADGVLKFDRKTMKRITRRDGLRDEQPQQLISSGSMLYAVHSKGIDKINCVNNHVSYYDIAENEFEPNLNAGTFAHDRLYSGTNNGVLVYRTSHISSDTTRPTVFIRSLNVNFRSYDTDSAREFRYDQNNFAISFAGIWLKNPDELFYRYKLEGLEKDWESATEWKTVNYNNLRPGKYSFVVEARNEEDVWSRPARFSFTILKPVWQHWWFWAIVLAGIAASLWLFVRYRLRNLQRENLLLERRVKERTFQIENQSKIIEKKNLELEQLSLVASKTDNVVLILDPEGKLEYVNESFVKQHNLSFEEVKNRYGDTIYELSNNEGITDLVKNAVQNKRSVSYESLNKKEEAGKGSWQSSTLTPIFSDEGQLKKIIIIDTDVTERKRQEQIILQKNKDITDSIYYAKKIQHAILPSEEIISEYIPGHFCLYMTKDIVSGDFYWFSHLNDFSIIAAIDCTGHGVPGAFMSLIGYNLLNKIVNENRVTDPGRILLELNRGVLAALHKNDTESRDGMDVAICRISHNTGGLEFAGAMRPLWTVKNKQLSEVKADKIPIGTLERDRDKKINYQTQTVKASEGERFFIFTDGYADQFGGDKDKKYSTARFKALLCNTSHLPFKEQEELLRKEHLQWRGDHEQIDDILVIGFELPAIRPAV